ncbi:MAG TPA: acyl-CoA dehydrogenase family protein [Candidatus Binatia bacterium]|jgi:alkylation response protein AidB-like acyl-CoA dehydrogenase
MEFGFTSEQDDVRTAAEKIFADLCKPELLPDCERALEHFDRELWKELARAGLLGVAIPESHGGMGFGIAELAILLEQAGRYVAPVPLFPVLLLGALPVVQFGSASQKDRWLPDVATGKTLLTGAIAESDSRDAEKPSTRARADGDGFVLDGVKICVPMAKTAARILVPASTAGGQVVLALVSPEADGVSFEAQELTTGEIAYRVALSAVKVSADDVLVGPDGGAAALAWIVDHAIAGLCAMELGAAERALRMTAKYTSERKQFGKVIATFQAVAQRAADAYIDVEAIRLTTWQAVWRLAEKLPARRELSIAKYWASEGGHRACYAAQHLHGGIGVDKDYPLHRYYLLSKRIELTLGGAQEHLARVGAMLAAG